MVFISAAVLLLIRIFAEYFCQPIIHKPGKHTTESLIVELESHKNPAFLSRL